jgi:hypothetical protein
LRDLALRVGKFVANVARYYWGMRQPLWEYIAGFLPDLASESVRMRQVRLNPEETYKMAAFEPEGWKVSIPGRCVVCGEQVQGVSFDESRLVENAARSFWVPAGSLLFGVTIGWLLFGRWFASMSLPLGIVAGYLLRGKVPVYLRLVRCHDHLTRTNVPQILAWGNTLVLRFGHKNVRRVFLYGEGLEPVVPQPDAATEPLAAGAAAKSTDVPETIPLADSPKPENSQITHELPPIFGPDDETSTPLIP